MTLVTNPSENSEQGTFERNAQALGIKFGMLVFHSDGSRYLNDNVQWLWEQYQSRR